MKIRRFYAFHELCDYDLNSELISVETKFRVNFLNFFIKELVLVHLRQPWFFRSRWRIKTTTKALKNKVYEKALKNLRILFVDWKSSFQKLTFSDVNIMHHGCRKKFDCLKHMKKNIFPWLTRKKIWCRNHVKFNTQFWNSFKTLDLFSAMNNTCRKKGTFLLVPTNFLQIS